MSKFIVECDPWTAPFSESHASSREAAEKTARQVARSFPGVSVLIYQQVAVFKAEIAPPREVETFEIEEK